MKGPTDSPDSSDKDGGAALILVLIIVTVVALVGAALLTFSDTSIRTTVALRDQSAAAYAADGAAQVAVSQIEDGSLDCSSPTPEVVELGSAASPFYIPVQSEAGPLNASFTCSPNTTEGATSTTTTTSTGSGTTIGGTASNVPPYALLAMGGTTTSDYGIDFTRGASQKTICIENGSVGSNTKINAITGYLGVKVSGTGSPSDCTTGSGPGLTVGASALGGCIGTSTGSNPNFAPTPCTQVSQINLPSVPTPNDPITRTNVAATCLTSKGTTYAAFQPGKYTNVALLNNPCGGARFVWFSPGTYYFDFGSNPWTWPEALLAGTPTNSSGTPITSVSAAPSDAASLAGLAGVAPFPTSENESPRSCADPALQSGSPSPGAQFVFGGASKVVFPAGGNAQICASYSSTSPPVAIYGYTNPTGPVTPQTMCNSTGCSGSLFTTAGNGQSQFYIRGFVYAPNAQIELTLRNSNGQNFNWGVVVRNFSLAVNGSSPTVPFIQLPSPQQGITTTTTTSTTYTIRYLNVWTCKASSSPCPQTGKPDVRVKVQTNGSSVKVLSWSVQR